VLDRRRDDGALMKMPMKTPVTRITTMFKTTIPLFLFTAAIAASAQTTPSWDSGTYTYDGAGNIIAIGTDHYGYDAFGRLAYGAAATPQSPTNAQTYKYDRYGNLLKVETTSVDGLHKSEFAVQPLTNQLTASCLEQDVTCMTASFDKAGNQRGLAIGNSDFQWDALGMMKELHLSTRHEQYVYDAGDERIVTIDVDSNTRRYSLRGGENGVARDALYEPQGDHWTWSRDYVYRNGMLISEFTASGQRHYHLDHLGTPRMVTDSTGFRLATHKYWPFGQEAEGSQPDVADRMRFTGHERDAVPGAPGHDLDYMRARYYGPMMERFMSVDKGPVEPERPQSWNRYSYTMNNPLVYVDPTGNWFALYSFRNDSIEQQFWATLGAKTGLAVSNNNGKIDYARDANGKPVIAKDANGKELGSATARNDLIAAIDSPDKIIVQRTDNNSSIDMGQRDGSLVRLDFADMAQINTSNNPAATFDAAMIFLHEGVGHAFFDLEDPTKQQLSQNSHWLGATVAWENVIRSELGLPARNQYAAVQLPTGRRYIPFAQGRVWLP
jgi:RHS repeat-associated protein